MTQKERVFIYERKEVVLLLLLSFVVVLFAFTLGVHYGKLVAPKSAAMNQVESAPIVGVPDQIPNRQELNEQAQGIQHAIDETLSHVLHEEVAKSGIKLETPRQVELPSKAKSKNGGATTGETSKEIAPQIQEVSKNTKVEGETGESKSKPEKLLEPLAELAAEKKDLPIGKFALQVGSYPALQEAKERVLSFQAKGLEPVLHEAEIKGKGKWFRIYLGGYPSKDAAEKAGQMYVTQHVIDSYVIAKLANGKL